MSDDATRRLRLIERILSLPVEELAAVEAFLSCNDRREPASESDPKPLVVAQVAWPHAPPHRLSKYGTYFVTTGTLHKGHVFRGAERLDHLHGALLSRAQNDGWQLEAWAIFSNHYHFVAHALDGAVELGTMLKERHRTTAIYVNDLDDTPGRQVWFNFRETALTYESSYYARLAYAHNNPVKHGLVTNARLYRWCSAGWFERTATPAQVATLAKVRTDNVKVFDEYEPV